jgi:lysophospholipase L1-like esterase
MKELGNCPDIIFIFGGTNDSWAGSPIGEYKYSDWANKDLYSFRPAMAYMLDYMTTRYLNTEIYFIVNNKLKPEITNSIHDICNHYNVKYLDLKDIDKKGNHPSVKGMEQIVDQLDEFLNLK